MSRSLRSYSPNNAPDVSRVPRGTPAAPGAEWQLASTLQERLKMIYCGTDPRYVLRLAERSRTYRDLIRRYSNDSML